MGGEDERRPLRERGDEPGRDEKVGVDDVRPRRLPRGPGQLEVAELPAGTPVEHGPVDVVSPPLERVRHLRHEDAEVGIVGPRVHLRDEEDAHRRGR